MGKNLFVIDDAGARFGRELSQGKRDPIRLHLAMSLAGARQLRDAIVEAANRAKPSAIESVCMIDERDRSRRATFRAYPKMRWIVQAIDDEAATRFDESSDSPALHWNRRDLPKALEVCDRLIAGEYDHHVSVTDSLDVWYWGDGSWF